MHSTVSRNKSCTSVVAERECSMDVEAEGLKKVSDSIKTVGNIPNVHTADVRIVGNIVCRAVNWRFTSVEVVSTSSPCQLLPILMVRSKRLSTQTIDHGLIAP